GGERDRPADDRLLPGSRRRQPAAGRGKWSGVGVFDRRLASRNRLPGVRGRLFPAALDGAGGTAGVVDLFASVISPLVAGRHPARIARTDRKERTAVILMAQNLSIFDPASPPAESIRSLSVLV